MDNHNRTYQPKKNQYYYLAMRIFFMILVKFNWEICITYNVCREMSRQKCNMETTNRKADGNTEEGER